MIEPRQSVVDAYRTGRGGFRLRASWKTEKLGRGLYQLVVSEIPYQVQKARLIERIAELLAARKLPLLADVRDESTEEVRIVLEPKNRTVDATVLMEQLFRQTDLEVRVSLNMNALDAANTPRVMGLRDVLAAFLEHRLVVLERRSRHREAKIKHRLEVLGGLLVVFLNLDEVIRIIREEDDPKGALKAAFELGDEQAEAILNMRLRQLRKLEELDIRNEDKALKVELADLRGLLNDEKRRRRVVADEIAAIRKRFGPKSDLGRRRTEIGAPPDAVAIPVEATVEREAVTVLCSQMGWMRLVKGHLEDAAEVKYKDGDRARFVLHAETTDKLVIFASNGRFYTLGCDRLPGGRGHGEPLRLMIDLTNGHDVVSMFVHRPGRRHVVASDTGRGFIVEEDQVIAHRRNGKQVLNLAPSEEGGGLRPGRDRRRLRGRRRQQPQAPDLSAPRASDHGARSGRAAAALRARRPRRRQDVRAGRGPVVADGRSDAHRDEAEPLARQARADRAPAAQGLLQDQPVFVSAAPPSETPQPYLKRSRRAFEYAWSDSLDQARDFRRKTMKLS